MKTIRRAVRHMHEPPVVVDPDTGKTYPVPTGGAEDDADPDNDGDEDDDADDEDGTDLEAEVRKWKAMARKHEKQAKSNADKAKKFEELEDSQKSEIEKATGKAAEAEKRAAAAEAKAQRLEVALDKAPEGMPVSRIRKLAKRLQGDSQEDLESDAEELFSEFAPPDDDDDGDDDGDKPPPLSGRPKEKLTPGASNEDDEDVDGDKIAEKILARNQI